MRICACVCVHVWHQPEAMFAQCSNLLQHFFAVQGTGEFQEEETDKTPSPARTG